MGIAPGIKIGVLVDNVVSIRGLEEVAVGFIVGVGFGRSAPAPADRAGYGDRPVIAGVGNLVLSLAV